MSAVKRWANSSEGGFTLVELLVAAMLMVLVLTMVGTTILTGANASQNAADEGQSLDPVLLIAQEAQQVLESAWTPGGNEVTSYCANSTGGSFPTGQGPFLEATTTTIEFCGVVGNSLKAYDYDVCITGSTSSSCSSACTSSSCSLEIDRWQWSGTTKVTNVIFKEAGLAAGSAPFSFLELESGSWQAVNTGTNGTADLSSIGAVELTLSAPAFGGGASTTTTSTTLPGTLPGTSLQKVIVLSNLGAGGL